MMNNSSARYHQKTKKGYKNKTRGKHQNLCEEKKKEKQQYGCDIYANFSGNEKRKLVEYRKNITKYGKNVS